MKYIEFVCDKIISHSSIIGDDPAFRDIYIEMEKPFFFLYFAFCNSVES